MIIEVQPSVHVKVTVLYEEPFWVGVVERTDERGYQVTRVVFGSEPTPAELYEYMRKAYGTLEFSTPTQTDLPEYKRPNFKRAQREAKRTAAERGLATKAQEAMRQELESRKQERQDGSRTKRLEAERLKFELKQLKRKEKQRGR